MKQLKLLIGLFILLSQFSFAQQITIHLNGQKDTTVFLLRYAGKSLFYADTAFMKNGKVTFDGKKQKAGMLGFMIPNSKPQKWFEFLYDQEDVVLETSLPDYKGQLKAIDSKQNEVYFEYIKFIASKKSEIDELTNQRNKIGNSADQQYQELDFRIKGLANLVKEKQNQIIQENSGKLVAQLIQLSKEVEIPSTVVGNDLQYRYYQAHYFDYFDFKDDRLVNLPLYQSKLEDYFGKNLMVQHWDTILKYGFRLCDQLNPKSKQFEFCVSWFVNTYQKSNIMGMDKVYSKMIERYYCAKNSDGKSLAYWVDDAKLKEMCSRARAQNNLFLGSVPPNVILKDTSDQQWKDFYSLKNQYIILYFWESDCEHCKATTPKLEQLYTQKLKARGVEVFAVAKATGDDFRLWKAFVKRHHLSFINVGLTQSIYKLAGENTAALVPKYTTMESINYQQTYDVYETPTILLLDKDKKIVAKKMTLSQLEDYIDQLQGVKNAPKIVVND